MSTLESLSVAPNPFPLDSEGTIREESLNLERLEQYATILAQSIEIAAQAGGDGVIFLQSHKNAVALREAHKLLLESAAAGEPRTIDVEWLLDNFTVVEEQLREIHEDLPRKFYYELPKTKRGLPRVYEIALGIIAHTDSAPDEQTLERFLNAYQRISPLSIGETWAFPIMLRLALIENLRRIAQQILSRRKCRTEAAKLVKEARQGAPVHLELDSLQQCAPTIVEVLQLLEEDPSASVITRNELEQRLREKGWDLAEMLRDAHRSQAANQVTIGNLITSMRLVSALDWMSFFEQVNLAEKALREDPAEIYPAMDAPSRDRYRREVERIAKGSKKSDLETAKFAVQAAELAAARGARLVEQHVGYYLTGDGVKDFCKSLNYRPNVTEWCRRAIFQFPLAFYLGSIGVLITAGLVLVTQDLTRLGIPMLLMFIINALAFLPASELSISIVNFFVTIWAAPRFLPKLELKEGIPQSRKTLVVVPCLLTSAKDTQQLLQRLESHYLSNADPALHFALLTDWPDSIDQTSSEDDELLEMATKGIVALNERHREGDQGPFLLLHRGRSWNAAENCWMGWERKRGKLMELHQWLRGEETSFEIIVGDHRALKHKGGGASVSYIITLDSDTQLPPGAAKRLVGAMCHPLNQPRLNNQNVASGYVLLQPRVGVTLNSANQTWYSRIYANSPGIDPYATASSDVYQDLFGEGSFTGKGIYDLKSFEQCLAGVFPENRILSHDLIEGCHSRVGLLSDVEVIDSFPARYEADARRQHRWARGDWQLLPWLFPFVPTERGRTRNRLSFLSYWKIVDNLRRSLMPASLLVFLIAAWWSQSVKAIGLACLVLAFPLLVRGIMTIRHRPKADGTTQFRYAWKWELSRTLLQCLLQLTFLPHRAFYLTDAIRRTLYRLCISKKRLLEWESAAVTESRVSRAKWSIPKLLWAAPIVSLSLLFILPMNSLLLAAPVMLAWIIAPLAVIWLDQRASSPPPLLHSDQASSLRRIARRTWFYFEEFVNSQSNWLPPDNVQEYPMRKIAMRISPTNEGLFLTSALAAHDFGFISLSDVVTLWENNLRTWEQLEGLRGHPFNWYDAQTLEPLRPRYVSTVDSGNLAVCFLTVRSGINDLASKPLFGATQWQGVIDTAVVLREVLEEVYGDFGVSRNTGAEQVLKQIAAIVSQPEAPDSLVQWGVRLAELRGIAASISSRLETLSNRRSRAEADVPIFIFGLLRLIEGLSRDFDALYAWIVQLSPKSPSQSEPQMRWKTTPPAPHAVAFEKSETWRELITILESSNSLLRLMVLDESTQTLRASLRREWSVQPHDDSVRVWMDELDATIFSSTQEAKKVYLRLERLGGRMESLAMRMEFGFLFNPRRRLFSIGFNVDEGRLDQSHYDMLASEARLAAYFSIVKGDTDYRSWFYMGRGLTEAAGLVGLVSWGGTMFEYLMPLLFQQSYAGSLITESAKMAVARQQEYGRQCNVPWGISESAFSSMASNHDYHYRSFGAPGIGLKRGLGKDLVISPYSTMLALEQDPASAMNNLASLAKEGALGHFGYFEAVDYTRSRLPKGKHSVVVRSYMAHHHGMSIVAIANLLRDGIMRRRFHQHPMGKAGELLLQEKLPEIAPLVDARDSQHDIVETPRNDQEVVSRKVTGYQSALPRTHLLTNGQYSLMVTSAGSGYSVANNMSVTRWRRDAMNDQHGQFIYLRQPAMGQLWSAGFQPTRAKPSSYEAIFSIDKSEVRRRDREVESHLEITIAPEHLAEIRTLKLTNHSERPLELELTSYAEVVLGSHAADLAHPAFQKLFIETEILKDKGAILARRRPRSSTEPAAYAFHVLAPSTSATGELEYESSRERFLGRGRNVNAPHALQSQEPLSGSSGAVLDPIFAIRQRVTIPPHERAQLTFTTGVAASREEALALIEHYRDPRHVTRAFEMAWAFQQAELRQLHVSPAKSHQYQKWAGPLLYPDPAWRAPVKMLEANRLGQPSLWRHGVSGDFPILLARFFKPEHLDTIRELLLAHRFWRRAGFVVDLVFVNDYPGSYLDGVHEQFISLLNEVYHQPGESPPNVTLVRSSQATAEELQLLEVAASVVLRCEQSDWETRLGATQTPTPTTPEVRSDRQPQAHAGDEDPKLDEYPEVEAKSHYNAMKITPASSSRNLDSGKPTESERLLLFSNPWGGFTEEGREYRMTFESKNRPPRPWSNVLANPRLGTLVTESGGGYTWFTNSREFKLTSWANDPTTDTPSEWLYLRDEVTGDVHHPLPQNIANHEKYSVTHAAGYSRFTTTQHGLEVDSTIFVAVDDPVKLIRVRVTNRTSIRRSLSLTYFVEWVLGVNRDASLLHVRSHLDRELNAVIARNPYIPEFADQVAFLTAIAGNSQFVLGRQSFLGRQQDPAFPSALANSELPQNTDAAGDPGAAAHCKFALQAGEQSELVFVLGAAASQQELVALVNKYSSAATCENAFQHVRKQRQTEASVISLRTPSQATNILMNHWLPNQVLACRIWGRSAFYQSGGAYGFRDQLQDCMAVVYSRPDLAREHLLRAAAHQFLEGDVQHWWHPPGGRGTRTKFSDDYLWLVLTVAHYVKVTGDIAVLDEKATFLTSPPLEPHEQERYELPRESGTEASLYEHCQRALDRAFRLGPHGLPLMGCGDWNDGMNKVGEEGKGESVWVGWFLLVLLDEFLPLMRARGDVEKVDSLSQNANQLRSKLESEAWDGAWYRRAYFDDGNPLGSSLNDECKIDSIAQSWAVFAKADQARCQEAMNQVWSQLVRKEEGLVLLFAPPFHSSPLDPGYIKGYLPGIRENGGQYTHAALWVAQALALQGQTDRAWEILEMINPISHSDSAEKIEKYQVEPYVVAADVYGVPPNLGRGGWTWYTGSAAWMYRVILETILGFELRGDKLTMRPRMPKSWPGFEMSYRYHSSIYEIKVGRKSSASTSAISNAPQIRLDGQVTDLESITLVNDGQTHLLEIGIEE